MHPLIESVDLVLDKDGNNINISITSNDGNKQVVNASVTKAGTFRFSYVHPEDDIKYRYNGVFSDKRSTVVIFPIAGDGIISSEPIPYKIKDE